MINPPNLAKSPFKKMRMIVPIQLVTDQWIEDEPVFVVGWVISTRNEAYMWLLDGLLLEWQCLHIIPVYQTHIV